MKVAFLLFFINWVLLVNLNIFMNIRTVVYSRASQVAFLRGIVVAFWFAFWFAEIHYLWFIIFLHLFLILQPSQFYFWEISWFSKNLSLQRISLIVELKILLVYKLRILLVTQRSYQNLFDLFFELDVENILQSISLSVDSLWRWNMDWLNFVTVAVKCLTSDFFSKVLHLFYFS